MNPIVAPSLDIEHWSSRYETGPLTLFRAMQKAGDATQWSDREKSVETLIQWWSNTSSYDPDLEPEGLITRHDLTPLSKEVLGVAASHRVRPSGLSWGIPSAQETTAWLASGQANTMRRVLTIDNTAAWWNRCLFKGSADKYYCRTEHLVCALMAGHPFVHMADSFNIPLHQLLPMDNTPSFISADVEAPVLPELC